MAAGPGFSLVGWGWELATGGKEASNAGFPLSALPAPDGGFLVKRAQARKRPR